MGHYSRYGLKLAHALLDHTDCLQTMLTSAAASQTALRKENFTIHVGTEVFIGNPPPEVKQATYQQPISSNKLQEHIVNTVNVL